VNRSVRIHLMAWCIILALIVALAPSGFADQTTGDRPTIGLALGGGGARGLAHIGVLERLDELHIPIDGVAATSMGAVVGSYFCLGFTPQEIDTMARKTDWRLLMTDRPERQSMSYRRKTDDSHNIWPFEIGITSSGLAMQRGLIMGQKFNYTFDDPDLYTAGYDGFDLLPIPFRPVANDLETGEIVVLDRGNLLQAVRASMAAPGAFPPVRIGERDLVDGYLRAMVPVNIVRDMGVDQVIAVHVGWSPGETHRDASWDLPSIILQSNFILTYANVVPDLAAADVVISVPQPDISLVELTRASESIEAGRRAVDAQLDSLLPLALPEEEYRQWRASIHRQKVIPPTIAAITIDNNTRVVDQTIRSRITQAIGDTLCVDRLAADMENIYELGVFESIDFHLNDIQQDTELVIEPIEKPYLPWILRIGGSYRMNYQNRGQLQFMARLTRLELNRLGGEMRGEIALGSLLGLGLEFYQPLEYSRTLFLVPGVHISSNSEPVYDGQDHLANYLLETWGATLDGGLNVGRIGELRAGVRLGHAEAKTEIGSPNTSATIDEVGALKFSLAFDQLDSHANPHRGLAIHLHSWLARPELGDSHQFQKYWGHLLGATSTHRWTFQFKAQAGGSEGDMPFYQDYVLGGLRDLTGIADRSLRGGAFGMVGAGALYHLAGLDLPYTSQFYAGGWIDVGNTWDQPTSASWNDLHLGTALTLLMETAFGPIETGFGYNSAGRGTLYLQTGIHFAHSYNQ